MGDSVKVKITAKAYEKYHPKTALSEFENDTQYVTKAQLDAAVREIKDWVIQVILLGGGTGVNGGDLNANDVLMRALADVNKKVFGGNIIDRNSSLVQTYYSGGDITDVQVTGVSTNTERAAQLTENYNAALASLRQQAAEASAELREQLAAQMSDLTAAYLAAMAELR